MKKMIAAIMAFFLLGGAIASAGFMPLPVVIHVNPAMAGWEVKVTNAHYGDSRTLYTDANGYAVIEWANVGSFDIGDEFIITSNGETKSVNYEGRDVKADFTFTDNMPCKAVEIIKEVEVIKEVPIEVIKEVEVPAPVDINYATYVIVGIIGGLIGAGLKIYRKADGSVAVQHKHKNVVGYHDPNIIHKAQPHKKGEISPKYADVKAADGYYKYAG